MFIIRPFDKSDADYKAIVEIDALLFPEFPFSLDEFKHGDATRDPNYPFQRDMVVCDGQVIAYGEYGQSRDSYHPEKYFFEIYVHLKRDMPQMREFYLQHVMDALQQHNLIALTSGMMEGFPAYDRFFAENGFKQTLREQFSRLELADFEAYAFEGVVEKVLQQGIQIKSISELMQDDPDWKPRLLDLANEVEQDVPTPDEVQELTMERFEQRTLKHPALLPDAWFVAIDKDQYVGTSNLFKLESQPDLLMTGLTGVRRSYRRRGIAMALKLKAIDYALRKGATGINTGNEENNPMYQLNLRLGFKPQPGWVEYEKSLT